MHLGILLFRVGNRRKSLVGGFGRPRSGINTDYIVDKMNEGS